MPTGNNVNLIHAAQGALYYKTDVSSTNMAGSLIALITVANDQVIMCKNLTISPPKTESKLVPLLGTSSQTAGAGVLTTGVYQNTTKDFEATSEAKISGTLALTLANDGTNAVMPDFINLATGTGMAISTTHRRHTFGDSTSGQAQVLTGGIFVAFDNGVVAGVVAMAYPTVNLGDIKPTGTDGHWEIDFEATAHPCEFALEVERL